MISVRKRLTVVLVSFAVICAGLAADPGAKGSGEGSSSSSDTKASKMFNLAFLEAMQVVDLLRSGALIIGALAILFWDRRPETWLQAELVFILCNSVFAYFAPAAALDFQTDGPTNVVHEMTAQCMGALGFGMVFVLYTASNDQAGRNLRYVLSAMFSTVIVVVHSFGQYKYSKDKLHFNLQHCSFAVLSLVLYAFANFVQLYRANKASGTSAVSLVNNSRLNDHLLFDGFLLTLIGFMDFGFPEFNLSFVAIPGFAPDGVLATYFRHTGALEIFLGLMAIFYCGLQNDSDKRALLRSRLVAFVFIYPLLFLYQWKHAIMGQQVFLTTLAVSGLQLGNALCALYISGKKKKY